MSLLTSVAALNYPKLAQLSNIRRHYADMVISHKASGLSTKISQWNRNENRRDQYLSATLVVFVSFFSLRLEAEAELILQNYFIAELQSPCISKQPETPTFHSCKTVLLIFEDRANGIKTQLFHLTLREKRNYINLKMRIRLPAGQKCLVQPFF